MNRRRFLSLALAAPALLSAAPFGRGLAARGEKIVVARSPTCGCCAAWVDRMREAGFGVEVHNTTREALDDLKRRIGLKPEQMSCHTAAVGGYFVEGHVPAADIARLLEEAPEIRGLAVPGMLAGSPGMEVGERRTPFDTLAIHPDGRVRVFAAHR